MKKIYFDYGASTPIDKEVLGAMLPFLKQEYGNPSSLHALGQNAMAAIDRARLVVAEFLDCSADEIFFTSGATEANNMVIQGVFGNLVSKSLETKFPNGKAHIITSAIEHESVLEVCRNLEKEGKAEVTYLGVTPQGKVQIEDVENALRPETMLVSLQYGNSEIGCVQNIRDIGFLLRRRAVLFHTDAVQATNYLDCRVSELNVNFLTLSSHKIYGPKGAGVVYIRKSSSISPIFVGGGQEAGMRSGTENVAAIVGMGKAIELLLRPRTKLLSITIRHMRDKLIKGVLKRVKGSQLTGSLEGRLPNNAHFTFEGVEGKDVVMLLDQKGVLTSTGSACSERSKEPSHVLLALGMKPSKALSSVRFSLGKYTREEDITKVLKVLPQTIDQLRKVSVK